jgi:hypothetical protein
MIEANAWTISQPKHKQRIQMPPGGELNDAIVKPVRFKALMAVRIDAEGPRFAARSRKDDSK